MTQLQADFVTLMNKAADFVQAGNMAMAENLYRQLVPHAPDNVALFSNLAFVTYNQGRVEEAISLFRKAIQIQPDYMDAHCNLALVFKNQGRLQEARDQFIAALKVNPQSYEGYLGLAGMMRDASQFDTALDYYSRAAAIRPTPDIYVHIGYVRQLKNMMDEAAVAYKKALELDPRHLGALNNLGTLYSSARKYEEAQALFETIIRIQPRNVQAWNNLGRIYKDTGQMDKAFEAYRKALEIQPDRVSVHSNYIFAMVYAAQVTPEQLTAAAKDFGRIIADPLLRKRPFTNDRDPGRRLRIGYVSGDYRQHSASYFIEPLIRNHDREKFELFAYCNTGKSDQTTERIKGHFHHWRDIFNVGDDEVADMIEADKIDILIDLSGHTGGNRLTVFARKPAPVQASWLGFPATTGMKAMDYRITDINAEPPGMTEELSVEQLWRLPQVFCCYSASEKSPAVIDHPPFEDNGYITFGCFNNFTKISDDVLRAWAQIMTRVPDSRLLLEIAGLYDKRFRAGLDERLRGLGMPMDRIILELRRPENQFVLYNKIDMALDPFPCNGGTTSMDTLWMGVPFVSVAGRHFVSRMGVTILTNAGLPELIARDVDEYVEKSVALATDADRLRTLRTGLREKFLASQLMDQATFARNIEDAYRGMWDNWCKP